MGNFDINMPLLYGEQANAFTRLQREIIGRTSDQSIFAWEPRKTDLLRWELPYLSPSTANFAETGTYTPLHRSATRQPYTITNRGLELTVSVVYAASEDLAEAHAVLDCFDSRRCTRGLAFRVLPANDQSPKQATEFELYGIGTLDAAYTERR
jgi:hypothetical protein